MDKNEDCLFAVKASSKAKLFSDEDDSFNVCVSVSTAAADT